MNTAPSGTIMGYDVSSGAAPSLRWAVSLSGFSRSGRNCKIICPVQSTCERLPKSGAAEKSVSGLMASKLLP
jgi:hypothetical protein